MLKIIPRRLDLAEPCNTFLSWIPVTFSVLFSAVGFLFWSCLFSACFTWMAATFWPHKLDLFNCLVFLCSGCYCFGVFFRDSWLTIWVSLSQCNRFFAIYMLFICYKICAGFHHTVGVSRYDFFLVEQALPLLTFQPFVLDLLQIIHPTVVLIF